MNGNIYESFCRIFFWFTKLNQLLYILTSIWVLPTLTGLMFCNKIILLLNNNTKLLYSLKKQVSIGNTTGLQPSRTCRTIYSFFFTGSKREFIMLDQGLGASPKNIFASFCLNFPSFCSFLNFSFIKFEKAYFNQHLESAAPKHWSKYTTTNTRETKKLKTFVLLPT